MVKNKEMNEQQLKDLLRTMPKIEDHRDPQDIYQNVLLKMNKGKRKTWILPSIATAAAILLFVFLAPNLMNWQQSADQSMEEKSSSQVNDKMEMARIEENQPNTSQDENGQIFIEGSDEKGNLDSSDAVNSYTAVYDADGEGQYVFTYYIPDQNAQNIVPISVVVPQEKNKTKFEQYKDSMEKLKEEEWGLSEYYPLKAKLTMDEARQALNVDLPADHLYGEGSASETTFTEVLHGIADMNNLGKINFSTEGKPGATFGNFGRIETLPINKEKNNAYYFYFRGEDRKTPYLVPKRSSNNIEVALSEMRNDIDNSQLEASIPTSIRIDKVLESGELLVIRLNDTSELPTNSTIIHTIEAILLTAKDFNFEKVMIETSNPERIGEFVFNEEWKVPIAPNRKIITE